MTYNVGDRVSWGDDTGTIIRVIPDDTWGYIIEFDDGGLVAASKNELEEA